MPALKYERINFTKTRLTQLPLPTTTGPIGYYDTEIKRLCLRVQVRQAGGASIPDIGRVLGHKSLASTMIYARAADTPLRGIVDTTVQAMLSRSRTR